MKYRYLLSMVFLLSVWGCAILNPRNLYPPDVVIYDVTPEAKDYPKTDPEEIILYPDPKFAPKSYVLLAHLKSDYRTDCQSEEELFGLFKKRASEVGADEVVVLEVSRPRGTKPPMILHGSQPRNDLGYLDHSVSTTGVTLVEGEPTPGTKEMNRFSGSALAIHSKPK